MQILKAGAIYFALVFAAGFVLGTIRVLFVVVSALCIRTCCKSSPKSKIFFKGEAATDFHKFYKLAP